MNRPNVKIIGGEHNTSVIGAYMFEIEEKLPENDLPKIIEDDVWIGTGVIILKGVKIVTGSIIAAGSIINKNVELYSIMATVPAKFIKKRFPPEEFKKNIEIFQSIK